MATLKTKFSVGLFLICGISVIIAGITWLGMSNYLEKGHLFVSYFDESVQGLDVDSPVKYRGVHIGRVHSIGVAPDGKLIEVVLKIESEIKPDGDSRNLVAQLKSVGITGLMFIELEQTPTEAEPYPQIGFKPDYTVISTTPSEKSKFFQGIDDIFSLFRSLDAGAISLQLTTALEKINQTLDQAQLPELLKDLRTTIQKTQELVSTDRMNRLMASLELTSRNFQKLAVNADGGVDDIRYTVKRLDRVIDTGGGNLEDLTTDLKTSAMEIKRATKAAAALLENTDHRVDSIQRQVLMTLTRIDHAADSLNRFIHHVENQPSQLIFSAPAANKP